MSTTSLPIAIVEDHCDLCVQGRVTCRYCWTHFRRGRAVDPLLRRLFDESVRSSIGPRSRLFGVLANSIGSGRMGEVSLGSTNAPSQPGAMTEAMAFCTVEPPGFSSSSASSGALRVTPGSTKLRLSSLTQYVPLSLRCLIANVTLYFLAGMRPSMLEGYGARPGTGQDSSRPRL
jgi:hypothetical protein